VLSGDLVFTLGLTTLVQDHDLLVRVVDAVEAILCPVIVDRRVENLAILFIGKRLAAFLAILCEGR